VGKVISEALTQLGNLDADALRQHRQDKFLEMGKKGL
jgi:acetyl-CoA carboxylase carboxyl transferase subunit alpha